MKKHPELDILTGHMFQMVLGILGGSLRCLACGCCLLDLHDPFLTFGLGSTSETPQN